VEQSPGYVTLGRFLIQWRISSISLKAKNRNVIDRTTLVLGFDFRNECSAIRTRYMFSAV
jgi:hypothetical protein